MKDLILVLALASLCACGDNSGSDTGSNNDATELRDWAKNHTSRAELMAQLAEAKMTLRLVTQSDPQSADAKELEAKIKQLEKELEELANSARQ